MQSFNTGEKIVVKILLMRSGCKIGENFLLAKIYSTVHKEPAKEGWLATLSIVFTL